MAIVKVPRTPKSSFNKNRRPSALLLDQIKHLEWAALPASRRKPGQLAKYKQVRTESQAAERIAQLTAIVLKAKKAPPPVADGVQPRVVLPPLPKAARSTRKTGTAKRKMSRRKTTRARTVARKTTARGRRR